MPMWSNRFPAPEQKRHSVPVRPTNSAGDHPHQYKGNYTLFGCTPIFICATKQPRITFGTDSQHASQPFTHQMHVFDQLPPAGQKLARIPRFGRLVGRMDGDQLGQLDSNAAVYWEVLTYVSNRNFDTTGLLDTGLKSDGARLLGWHDDPALLNAPNKPVPLKIRKWQVRLALSFLSAVAFQMMCGQNADGKPAPMDRVEEDDVESFEDAVRDSMIAAGTYVDEGDVPLSRRMWSRDWECIQSLNAGLDYNMFSDCGTRILFTDNNFRDFLAAHWAVRWASPEEQRLTQDWLPYYLDDKADFTEFWNRVIELRELPVKPKQKLAPFLVAGWESLIAPIYDIRLQANPTKPIRSSELMYRTWDRMEDHPSMHAFQSEYAELCKTSPVAQSIIKQEDGTSQFIRLAAPNDPREKETFAKVGDPARLMAEFQMGSSDDDSDAFDREKPKHRVFISPFAMHRFCVTNEQFELFDPLRKHRRAFADESDSVDQHPVVNVNWFDGWCFGKWIGQIDIDGEPYHLQYPSEAQWEYACRCGASTSYTWGDGSDGNRIDSSKAWYGWWEDQRPEKRRTISVHGEDPILERPIPANPWGLHQMHGNVWEWCRDWYSSYELENAHDPKGPATGTSRVLRGGSWFYDGRSLRSAYRDWYRPSNRLRFYGFRLAAVPMSSARVVEQADA